MDHTPLGDWEVPGQEPVSSNSPKGVNEDNTGAATTPDFDKQPLAVWLWLRDECEWSMHEKFLYWILYSHRNTTTGQCDPGLRRLAKGMGVTPKVVTSTLAKLEAIGAVKVIHRREPGSKEHARNFYILEPPWTLPRKTARTPRGMHAQSKRQQVTPVGRQVDPSGIHVEPTGTKGVSELDTTVCPTGARNCQLEHDKGTDKKKSHTSASSKRGTAPRFSQDALDLAQALYDWLKENNALPGDRGFFTKQAGIAENALLPVRPKEEWLACLEWAKTEPYWSTHLSSLRQLGQSVWPQYARRSQAVQKLKKTTPFAQGPRFDDPNSIFFRGGSAK